MKVAVIFGTRPEAIKCAPVALALRQHPKIEGQVCVTGQHREMLDQVLETFGIIPDFDLDVMQPGQSLNSLTARLMDRLDDYMSQQRPDLVLVQGDTTSAFCGALSAFYHKIPVAHIEAGLRTFDLHSPWPEEANRSLIGRLASLHFAPTATNREHLLREGVPAHTIAITGNTVIDALLLARQKVREQPPGIPGLPEALMSQDSGEKVVLITGHRRENLGQGFESICRAIAELARRFPEIHFVYPVHLNPRVREPVHGILGVEQADNIHLIEPLSYLPFVALMERSCLILTDSGGIQEEAPSLGKPVLVMRDTTEREEALLAGTVRLIGTDADAILAHATELLTDKASYLTMARAHNPYGDGNATEAILAACLAFLEWEQVALECSFSSLLSLPTVTSAALGGEL